MQGSCYLVYVKVHSLIHVPFVVPASAALAHLAPMHFSLLALLLATPTLGFSPLVPLHPPLPPPSHLFSTPQGGPDTLNAFSHDCATAVNARLDIDPTLPSFTVNRKRFVPDYQHLWTSKEWDQHISRWR